MSNDHRNWFYPPTLIFHPTDLPTLAMIVPLVLAVFWLLCVHLFRRRRQLPLPPGPMKLPLIGNLFDMPQTFEWETYHQWCKEFGMSSRLDEPFKHKHSAMIIWT